MKLFIDSANIADIQQAKAWGVLDGVTTNPTLIKQAVEAQGKKKISLESYLRAFLAEVAHIPVSLEVTGTDATTIIQEGRTLYKKFHKLAPHLLIKIPINPCQSDTCTQNSDGIRAIKTLSAEGIPINCTLIFTPEQALLAAHAGAKIVSPFVGREDDYIREINHRTFDKKAYFPAEGFKNLKKMHNDNGIVSGVDLIKKCKEIFVAQKIKGCEILAASIRNARQFREVEFAGADIATLPLSVIPALLRHPKTAEGMRQFVKDTLPEYTRITHAKKKRHS